MGLHILRNQFPIVFDRGASRRNLHPWIIEFFGGIPEHAESHFPRQAVAGMRYRRRLDRAGLERHDPFGIAATRRDKSYVPIRIESFLLRDRANQKIRQRSQTGYADLFAF